MSTLPISLHYSQTHVGDGEGHKGLKGSACCRLFFRILTPLFCLLLFCSCAPRHIGMPSYEGVSLEAALSELRRIESVEAILSLEYDKSDAVMSGDASLRLSERSLDLRVYYLGFLAGEVREDDGVIRTNLKMDNNKRTILVDGLRNSVLWWRISDYAVSEEGDLYVLRNSERRIAVSKKTLLPVEQTIELENGDTITVSYNLPERITRENQEGSEDTSFPQWYPSELTLKLRNHSVKVKVKSYSVVKS